MAKQNKLMQYVQDFFRDYLAAQRGLSVNTIKTYRDSLKLFLKFIAFRKNKKVSKVTLDDLDTDNTVAFLKEIEKSRGNSIATRNLRLASLKTFFAYLISQDIFRSGKYQQIMAVPLKRSPKPLIEYLEVDEVSAITQSIKRQDLNGERDYVILNLLYNTGARVSEICNLKVEQIRFESPPLIAIVGKGQKLRHIPLWKETATILYNYINRRNILDNPKATIFLNARGKPLSRFGIRHIIQERAGKARCQCPS